MLRDGLWFVVPQAASRATSFVIFALLASKLPAELLGVFAVASAVVALAPALAPAIVGKPLANLRGSPDFAVAARRSSSGAVLLATVSAVVLLTLSVALSGRNALVLAASGVGVAGAMLLEASFWQCAFVRTAKRAGILLAIANFLQLVVVVVGSVWIQGTALVVLPFAALVIAACLVGPFWTSLHLAGGLVWLVRQWTEYLSYVLASASALVVGLLVPIVLASVVNYEAAAAFRASELVFGLINMLIGVSTQFLLTRVRRSLNEARSVFVTLSAIFVPVTAANGALIFFLPSGVLEFIVGSVASLLSETTPWFTAQRIFLVVASLASVLLVTVLSRSKYALVSIAGSAAVLTLTALGAHLGGLDGAVVGLAVAEALTAAVFAAILFREAPDAV